MVTGRDAPAQHPGRQPAPVPAAGQGRRVFQYVAILNSRNLTHLRGDQGGGAPKARDFFWEMSTFSLNSPVLDIVN